MAKRRKNEEKLLETLKDPNETHSKEITSLMEKTIRGGHKVYCATDWHLWTRCGEKGTSKCKRRKDFDKIIKAINETMTAEDLLIYLGDLVDGEFGEPIELKTILKTLPGKKILVLGNNDVFPTTFYKSCGFEYVVQSFVWHNVLFTHMPVRNDNQINIHGHIHGYHTYWIPYRNHVDVAACGGRTEPVELGEVIKAQRSYSKNIKECPEHFNEGYIPILPDNYFHRVMVDDTSKYPFCEDPFTD